MTTLKFQTQINAPKEKVWETLWSDEGYRQWTGAFCAGSYAESDWEEGSRILFLDPAKNGMFSTIEKKIPNEQMIFSHLGEMKNGVEEPKEWAGAKERYYLEEQNGVTELNVVMDSNAEMEEYLKNSFPKALDELKRICES